MAAPLDFDTAHGPEGLVGTRVTVMGLGLFGGGAGAARWAHARGADVTVTDLRDASVLEPSLAALAPLSASGRIRFELGGHREADFQGADLVIVNPAVPPGVPMLGAARDAGATICTATEIFLRQCAAPVLAITGTHGKSSTATFLRDALAFASGKRVLLGGNIGGSLLDDVATLSADDAVILELSSYQLEHLSPALLDRREGSVGVAAITNLGTDHLERHGTVPAYHAAKRRILSLAGADGVCVVPESLESLEVQGGLPCRVLRHGGVDSDVQVVHETGAIVAAGATLGSVYDLRVLGAFQRRNLAVALAAAHAFGAQPEALAAAVPTLKGLAHRMEPLGSFEAAGGAFDVIDNGVSTTPESTMAALESMGDTGPIVWIAGGERKRGTDLDELAQVAAERSAWLVPFGAAADELAGAMRRAGGTVVDGDRHATDAEEAVDRALSVTRGGAAWLFSPACASFDRYPNFRERATAFRQALVRSAGPAGRDSES